MSTGIRRLFDELRATSVVVIHPPGADCNVLVDQLRRIGCAGMEGAVRHAPRRALFLTRAAV